MKYYRNMKHVCGGLCVLCHPSSPPPLHKIKHTHTHTHTHTNRVKVESLLCASILCSYNETLCPGNCLQMIYIHICTFCYVLFICVCGGAHEMRIYLYCSGVFVVQYIRVTIISHNYHNSINHYLKGASIRQTHYMICNQCSDVAKLCYSPHQCLLDMNYTRNSTTTLNWHHGLVQFTTWMKRECLIIKFYHLYAYMYIDM